MYYTTFLVAAAILVLAPLGSAQSVSRPYSAASHLTTQQLLDQIDTENFLDPPILIASGQETVKVGFLSTPEVKALLVAPDAVPAMLARLDRPGGLHDSPAQIVYFIVFERLKDRRTLRPLAAYLDSLPAREIKSAGVPAHPFQYALDAVQAQIPMGLLPADGTDAPFRARHKIAARIRAWLKHGVKQKRS